jgi:hypothetical protein
MLLLQPPYAAGPSQHPTSNVYDMSSTVINVGKPLENYGQASKPSIVATQIVHHDTSQGAQHILQLPESYRRMARPSAEGFTRWTTPCFNFRLIVAIVRL